MSEASVTSAEEQLIWAKKRMESAESTEADAKQFMNELNTSLQEHLALDADDWDDDYEEERKSLHKSFTRAQRNWRTNRNERTEANTFLQNSVQALEFVKAARKNKELKGDKPVENPDDEDKAWQVEAVYQNNPQLPNVQAMAQNHEQQQPPTKIYDPTDYSVFLERPARNGPSILQLQELTLQKGEKDLVKESCPMFTGDDPQIPFSRWMKIFQSVAMPFIHTAVSERDEKLRDKNVKCTPNQIKRLVASLVRSKLTGSALHGVTTTMCTHETMLNYLNNRFPAPDESTALSDLNELKMNGSISIGKFADQFEGAVATLTASRGQPMSDVEMLAQFTSKLHPQLRLIVQQHVEAKRSTYAKMKTLAITLQMNLRKLNTEDTKSSTPALYPMAMSTAKLDDRHNAHRSMGRSSQQQQQQQQSGTGQRGTRHRPRKTKRPICPRGTNCLDNKSVNGCSMYHTTCRFGTACTRVHSNRGCGYWHPKSVRNGSKPGRSETGFITSAISSTQHIQHRANDVPESNQSTFMTLHVMDRTNPAQPDTMRLSTFKIIDRDSGRTFTALCDSGSGINIITARVVKQLRLRTVERILRIATVNNVISLRKATQITIEGQEIVMHVCNSLVSGVDMLLTPASCHRFGVEVTQLKLRDRHKDPEVTAMMTVANSERLPENTYKRRTTLGKRMQTSIPYESKRTATTAYTTNWNTINASTNDTDLKQIETKARQTLEAVVTATKNGPMRMDPIKIATIEHNPVVVRQRGYNVEETAFIDNWINASLQTGKLRITENNEPRYMTNLLPVKKPGLDSNGHQRFRMTQNLAPVNPYIVADEYPLPTMDDTVRQVHNDILFFSEVDISDAYHQLPVHRQSQVLSGFLWKGIHYVLTVLAQGAMNAPAAYQRAMDTIVQYATTLLPTRNRSKLFAYFDNVLCLSPSAKEHAEALDALFTAMIHFNCQPNATKSHLWRSKLSFLVFQLQRGNFEMRTDLLQSIRTAKRPTTVPELKSFIGLASLLRRYAPKLTEHLRVLQPLLQTKRLTSKWKEEHENAYQTIITKLAKPVQLQYWNGTDKLVIYTDASDTYVSAVILSSNRPVAYWSKALTEPQLKWGIQDTELLAITSTLKRFEGLCRPRHIELHVDNKTVVHWVKTPCWRKLDGKVARMISYIHGFTHTVEHVNTHENPSDFFSRYCIAEDHKMATNSCTERSPDEKGNAELITTVLTIQAMADESMNEMEDTENLESPNLWSLPFTKQELIQSQHRDEDPSVQLPNNQLTKVMVGGIVCVHDKAANTFSPIMGSRLIMKTIRHLHETHGHASLAKMKAITKGRIHIPRLKQLLEVHMKSCDFCMRRNPQRAQHSALQQIHVSAPNERWQMDFFSLTMLLAEREDEGEVTRHYLNVIDLYSGLTMVEETKDQTASSVLHVLKRLILQHGKPLTISSDNGTHFTSHKVKSFLENIGVNHILAIPWHPMSNGAVEASNKSIKHMLRSHMKLEEAKYVVNSIPRTRQELPPLAIYLRKFNPLQDAMNPLSSTASIEYDKDAFDKRTRYIQELYAKQFDAKHSETEDLSAGQLVYVRNTTDRKFSGPRIVKRVHKNHVITTTMNGRRELRTHTSRVKPGCPKLLKIVDDPSDASDRRGEESPNPDPNPTSQIPNTDKENDDDETEYEIEKILSHRRKNPDSEVEFRVKWKGYRTRDATWELASGLPQVSINDYWMRISN